jgi:hypothetical protein
MGSALADLLARIGLGAWGRRLNEGIFAGGGISPLSSCFLHDEEKIIPNILRKILKLRYEV